MSQPFFHIALDVADIEQSVDFYRRLFGVEPGRHEPDYARFEPGEPAVVLSLNHSRAPRNGSGPNHLGIRFADTAALETARQRVNAAGLATEEEAGVECCYARQDKHWLVDPDGNPWELYVVTEADLARHGKPAPRAAADESSCCTPECCA
jgi:catechol 2,3-dioxygenase-like lactoylglutathione lyase family enzyme